MIQKFKNNFRDTKQYRIFLLLCLATIFNFILVGYRLYYLDFDFGQIHNVRSLIQNRGSSTFLFLVWNLFLAWIPYWIALSLEEIYRKRSSKILAGIVFFTWLFFFPNAPYIITDLLHLKSRQPIPHWYDLMLIVSFAWTGLMLGYLSLFEIHLFFKKRIPQSLNWLITIGAILLGSFGIYLGRFLRWNSWDVVYRPFMIIEDVVNVLSNPLAHDGTLGIAVVLSGFLMLGYLMMSTMISER